MNSLKGQLLIATPRMSDPNFARAVILMVEHDGDGAWGLILNRPTQLTVRAAWEQVSQTRCGTEGMIFQGGPCDGSLMVIHTLAAASQIEVCEGVHVALQVDKVEWLVAQGVEPAKFVAGYAGWAQGQLEAELTTDSWFTSPATADLVFDGNEDLWETLMVVQRWAAVGVRSLRAKLIPADPSLN
jgi:putative transcriptional regulator